QAGRRGWSAPRSPTCAGRRQTSTSRPIEPLAQRTNLLGLGTNIRGLRDHQSLEARDRLPEIRVLVARRQDRIRELLDAFVRDDQAVGHLLQTLESGTEGIGHDWDASFIVARAWCNPAPGGSLHACRRSTSTAFRCTTRRAATASRWCCCT